MTSYQRLAQISLLLIFIASCGGGESVQTSTETTPQRQARKPQEISKPPPPKARAPLPEKKTAPVIVAKSLPKSPPPKPVNPSVPSAGEEGLFEFMNVEQNFELQESGSGSSIRGDEVPENLRKKNSSAEKSERDKLRADLKSFVNHPNRKKVNDLVKALAGKILEVERADPNPRKTLQGSWKSHTDEVKKDWLPQVEEGVSLMESIEPATRPVRDIWEMYSIALKELKGALQAWSAAIPANDVQEFELGYSRLRRSEKIYKSAADRLNELTQLTGK